jgi:hypothetical protein
MSIDSGRKVDSDGRKIDSSGQNVSLHFNQKTTWLLVASRGNLKKGGIQGYLQFLAH